MIPDEAVEAAAGKLVEMRRVGEHSSYEYARAALEAADPHMLAGAWDEGEDAGWINNAAESESSIPIVRNPYHPTP